MHLSAIFTGLKAELNGIKGKVEHTRADDRHLYFHPEGGEPVILISLRRDGVWREVGKPANSKGMAFLKNNS